MSKHAVSRTRPGARRSKNIITLTGDSLGMYCFCSVSFKDSKHHDTCLASKSVEACEWLGQALEKWHADEQITYDELHFLIDQGLLVNQFDATYEGAELLRRIGIRNLGAAAADRLKALKDAG